MREMKGSELLAKSVVANGVKYVFTVNSPRLGPVIDALKKEEVVEIVRARNETAATIMADGYVRRSRRVSAVLTESNGAALSQISGVTNAWADKIPLLSISLCGDEEPDFNKGVDRHRYDQNGVFGAVTQWRKRVASIEEIPEAIEEGINKSMIRKGGPVHLDIPAGFLEKGIDPAKVHLPEISEPFEERRVDQIRLAGDEFAIDRAVALIKSAKRPLIFCGAGVHSSDASEKLLDFIEGFGIPAATSMAGIGSVPLSHKYSIGGPSYAAGEAFHVAINDADVVIAVGASFGGLEGFGLPPLWSGKIKFIHIDIAELQIGLNVQPHVTILGDARTVLGQLTEKLKNQGFSGRPGWGRWRGRLYRLKLGRRKRLDDNANRPWPVMHQGRFAMEFDKLMQRDDLLMVIDGGNTPLYAAMYAVDVNPRQVFFPFGMAALGGGVPYAIGIQLASPDKRVVLVTGDGSFMYNLQELETIRRLNLPIIIVVNNDGAWNMIKALQDNFFARNYVGTLLPDIDYAKIARGFGFHAQRITRVDEILPAYEKAASCGGPALIDCVTDGKNVPDSLLSFALVEFEGVLGQLNPIKVIRGQMMNMDAGWHRNMLMLTYIRKALLRINPLSRIGRAI